MGNNVNNDAINDDDNVDNDGDDGNDNSVNVKIGDDEDD